MNLKDKIIAFDIDGTLARNNGIPSDFSFNTISSLIEKGYHICLVTGRNWISSYKVYERCNMKNICVLCNGALVYDPINDKTIREVLMKKEDVLSFIDDEELMQYVEDFMFEVGMDTYSLTGFKWHENQIVGNFHDTMKREPNSLNVMAKNPEDQEKIRKLITKNPNYNYRYWYKQGELYSVHFSKKEGVEAMLKYYGKTPDDLIFFGDAENDSEALKYAGCGIAMKNAADDVKKCADKVTTLTNDEDGAVLYLLELIKND